MMDFLTGKALPDSQMLAKASDFFVSNGMVSHIKSFPSGFQDIVAAYKLTGALETPSRALQEWAQLLADIAFRLPALHIALNHTASDVLVYNLRLSNPYPKWALSYGKSNHAVNDLFVFNVAQDQVPEELAVRHAQSVGQIRGAWLDFCYGKQPWKPMKRDSSSFGPLFNFENGPTGREAESLEQAIGAELASRWRMIMDRVEQET